MKWNNHNEYEETLWVKLIKSILVSAIIMFLSVTLFMAEEAFAQVATDAVKSFYGEKHLDWFDSQLQHENTRLFVAIMALASLIGFMAVSAMLHMRTRDSIEKKVEDEANEVKSFNQYVTQRLLESVSDQMKKDLFQTISQGQAALWKPKE